MPPGGGFTAEDEQLVTALAATAAAAIDNARLDEAVRTRGEWLQATATITRRRGDGRRLRQPGLGRDRARPGPGRPTAGRSARRARADRGGPARPRHPAPVRHRALAAGPRRDPRTGPLHGPRAAERAGVRHHDQPGPDCVGPSSTAVR